MKDLATALNWMNHVKDNPVYKGYKIGKVIKPFVGDFPTHKKGDIVVFREYLTPDDSEIRMGEYMNMTQKPTGQVTIEIPLTQQEINKNKKQNSGITTIGTMVGVPIKYLQEMTLWRQLLNKGFYKYHLGLKN